MRTKRSTPRSHTTTFRTHYSDRRSTRGGRAAVVIRSIATASRNGNNRYYYPIIAPRSPMAGPQSPQPATMETTTAPTQLATLEAVRVLAVGVRGRPPFPLTPESLAAAEALLLQVGPGPAAGAGRRRAAAAVDRQQPHQQQHQQHAARLVLQWAVGVLVAPHGGAGGRKDEAPAAVAASTLLALREARVWRVCERALTPAARSTGLSQQPQLQQQQGPSLAKTLPQASALGLFQAAAAAVFAEGTTPPDAAEAAVRAVAALTGLPYPPLESWTLYVRCDVGGLHAFNFFSSSSESTFIPSPRLSNHKSTGPPSTRWGSRRCRRTAPWSWWPRK